MLLKIKTQFKKLSMTSQIGFFIGIATILFWHFFLIFEFSDSFKHQLDAFKNIVITKVYQFRADNQYSMQSYDYERIRINLSNIDFQIPLEEISIVGNFGENIVSSGKNNKIEPAITLNDGKEFVFVISKKLNFYYFLKINFFDHPEEETKSKITAVINLNPEIKKFFWIIFCKYILVLLLMFFQAVMIYFLGRKIATPLVKISKYMKENQENLMVPDVFGENLETKQFIVSYNERIENEKNLRHQLVETEKKVAVANAINKLAKQLSHDIRSPLAALRVVKDMGAGEMAPELSKLLGMSIDRITDIANTILPKGEVKNSSTNIEPCFLWMLLDQIISEKRVEYKDESHISIQFESDQSPFLMNAFCNSTEFMRSISNMVNNSIEARILDKLLEIKVRLSETEDQIVLSIVDNGKGIPAEILSKVFDESFSHEKKQGTGLGLYQVKQAIESWGGKVGIESQVNVGTTITMKLKKSEKPEWLTEPIEIKNYNSIVVLDDEEYVFTILEDRFSEYGKKIEYFKSIKEFESKLAQHENRTLYLMDHDLKQGVTGLQLIEKYQLQTKAILLTGNYDDKSVQQTAIKINAKILPKPLIHDLPIEG